MIKLKCNNLLSIHVLAKFTIKDLIISNVFSFLKLKLIEFKMMQPNQMKTSETLNPGKMNVDYLKSCSAIIRMVLIVCFFQNSFREEKILVNFCF